MWRGRAPLEHVEPPGIISIVNSDMVGHEIEYQAEVMSFQRIAQSYESSFVAKLGIEPVMIDNVIAMRGAPPRLQKGRRVDMADSQRFQVRDDIRRRIEAELFRQLKTIGREGNGWGHCAIGCASPGSRMAGHRTMRDPI